MSVYRSKEKGCFVFEFRRTVAGHRLRVRKHLPKTWNQAQADAFDRAESARLYAEAAGVTKPDPGIEEAVACYLKERAPTLKDQHNRIAELARIFHYYQGRPLSSLPDVCRAITIKEKDRLAPATIRNRIRYLTSACRYGWKHHGMGDFDPAARVVLPQVNNARQFYLTREQMIHLARHCKSLRARAIIRIAFYSGMRLGEILKAARVGNFFSLPDSKNGEPRLIPVHPKIASAKVRISYGRVEKNFRDAREAAGMDWLHFHDLRHSAASAMINADVDLYTVGAVLGHKSSESTKRYAHLATKKIEQAVLKIGKKVA